MLDPLQNLLDCIDIISKSRQRQAQLVTEGCTNVAYIMLQMVGEMDHLCELQRQWEEIDNARKKR